MRGLPDEIAAQMQWQKRNRKHKLRPVSGPLYAVVVKECGALIRVKADSCSSPRNRAKAFPHEAIGQAAQRALREVSLTETDQFESATIVQLRACLPWYIAASAAASNSVGLRP
jgi:hypothetical protein